MIFVKPAPGLKVRRPRKPYDFLPEGGAWVNPHEHGGFWLRRIAQKDVVDATAEETAAAEKKAKDLAAAAQTAEVAAAAAEAATHTPQVQQ